MLRLTVALLPLLAACSPDYSDDSAGDSGATVGDGADGTDSADGSDGADGGDGTPTDWPELVANEIMSSNAATIADESGAFPDWVELYNPGSADIDLSGWSITDDLSDPAKHIFAAGVTVPGGGYLLLWADDDEQDGPNHLPFKLAAEGEQLGLFAPDGTAMDQVEFGEIGTDISVARTPDGSADWQLTDDPTPGASNGGG